MQISVSSRLIVFTLKVLFSNLFRQFLIPFRFHHARVRLWYLKRSVLDELHGFDEKFKLLADYDLVIRLILNNYKGIYFESNVVTYKLGEQITKFGVQSEAECNHIFYKKL